VDYVGQHYGRSTVIVFDGYNNGCSTKDHEHKRRATRYAPDISVELMTTAYHDQSSFLCSDVNKSVFVALLIDRLKLSAFTVHQAADDADTLVVKVALELAASNHTVNVIGNDTDLFRQDFKFYG